VEKPSQNTWSKRVKQLENMTVQNRTCGKNHVTSHDRKTNKNNN